MAKTPVKTTDTKSNSHTINQLRRIVKIFVNSDGAIRPHSIITGPSGSGKSHLTEMLAEEFKLGMLAVNAAQLTKEGTSGNSLSKALSPLLNMTGLVICFVDEFDKLFISGNSNSSLAHETTLGVQNEFLRVLESSHTSVYGEYGKYVDAACDKVLFIFAGAFNGEADITLDRLRDFGIKTEFLGRVGLTFALEKLTLGDLNKILGESQLLASYMQLFKSTDRDKAIKAIMDAVEQNFEKNTLGVRILNNLIHRYFISGGTLDSGQVKQATFQKTMSLDDDGRP